MAIKTSLGAQRYNNRMDRVYKEAIKARDRVEREHEAYFIGGIELLAKSDYGMQTIQLKRAIKEIENLIYVRENVPF